MDTPPPIGHPTPLEDGITLVRAPNASPMTYWGTNSYLLGVDRLVVIDPGPADPAHLTALLDAIGHRPVSHILVTHSHLDHSPLARALSDQTGAAVLAFGDSLAGRSAIMEDLAQSGLVGGGEGVDAAFQPDERLADGAELICDGFTLTALHTPGHFSNHMSFLMGAVGFTGDHLMGWASTLISPPDGDLTAFMASCERLQDTAMTRAYCGHGAPVTAAQPRLAELIAHRHSRESAILAALSSGKARPDQLTQQIYTDIPPALRPMAERNVLAHLIDLTQRGLASPDGPISASAYFNRTGTRDAAPKGAVKKFG